MKTTKSVFYILRLYPTERNSVSQDSYLILVFYCKLVDVVFNLFQLLCRAFDSVACCTLVFWLTIFLLPFDYVQNFDLLNTVQSTTAIVRKLQCL